MKRFSLVVLLAVMALSGEVSAAEQMFLSGKVLDERSKPLPYASIFFKHHPLIGAVSDDKGVFEIAFGNGDFCQDTELPVSEMVADTLIISMLGYETLYVPADRFNGRRQLSLRMKEYRYTLDEARIKASKNDRKQRKAEMKRLLERIYERLTTVDAPQNEETYRIVSDIVVLRDSIPITINHLAGSLTEIPGGKKDGRDSVYIKVSSISSYMDSSMKKRLENLDVTKFSKKEQTAVKKAERKTEDKTVIHKALWSVTDVKNVLETTKDEARYWKFEEKDNQTLTVCYTRKYGFMGVVSATQNLFLTVDRNTAAITSASCDIITRVNLPFGYRLNQGELEILNMVNLNEDDLEKFKIKTVVVKVRGIVNNREKGGRMVPSEKSMKNAVSIRDRKENTINFTNTCTLRVLD